MDARLRLRRVYDPALPPEVGGGTQGDATLAHAGCLQAALATAETHQARLRQVAAREAPTE